MKTKKVTITLPEQDFNAIVSHLNQHLSTIDGKIRHLAVSIDRVPPQYKSEVENELKRTKNVYVEASLLRNKLKGLTK